MRRRAKRPPPQIILPYYFKMRRSKQDEENEHRPQGVYFGVHAQGGAEFDKVLRSFCAF